MSDLKCKSVLCAIMVMAALAVVLAMEVGRPLEPNPTMTMTTGTHNGPARGRVMSAELQRTAVTSRVLQIAVSDAHGSMPHVALGITDQSTGRLWRSTTSASGIAEFSGVPTDDTILAVYSDRGSTQYLMGAAMGDECVRMDGGSDVRCVVVNPAGKRVANALVWSHLGGVGYTGFQLGSTDASGVLDLRGVCCGLRLRAENDHDAPSAWSVSTGNPELTLTLEDVTRRWVLCVKKDNAPVAAARVEMCEKGSSPSVAYTGIDGVAQFALKPSVLTNEMTATVDAYGCAPRIVQKNWAADGEVIAMGTGCALRVHVSRGGLGVREAQLEWRGPVLRRAITKSDGSATLCDLPPGRTEFACCVDGQVYRQSFDVVEPRLDVEWELPTSGTVTGRVLCNGSPVAWWPLRVLSTHAVEVAKGRTRDDGTFVFEHLQVGDASQLGVCDPISGYELHRQEVKTGGHYEVTVPVAALASGRVQGRLHLDNGLPVEGAAVLLSRDGDPKAPVVLYSDAQGEFEVERLPVGRYWIRTTPKGWRSPIVDSLEVVAGGAIRYDTVVVRPARIAVKLDGASAEALTTVRCAFELNGVWREMKGALGCWEIDNMAPATYRLKFYGMAPVVRECVAPPGGSALVEQQYVVAQSAALRLYGPGVSGGGFEVFVVNPLSESRALYNRSSDTWQLGLQNGLEYEVRAGRNGRMFARGQLLVPTPNVPGFVELQVYMDPVW